MTSSATVRSANSTKEGRFEIRDLPAGTYEVRAEPGWGPGRPNLVPTTVKGVAAGTQDLLLEVEEGLRITGTVLRADGTPLPEGNVNAQQVLPEGEGGNPVSANGPVLQGKFELTGLAPGKYRLGVGGSDVPWKQVEVEAGGEPVKIQYGQGGGIDGRVVKADGSPAAGVFVWAQGPEAGSGAVAGPDGRFSVRELPAGTYAVSATLQAGEGPAQHGTVQGVAVAAGSVAPGVEIALQAEEKVPGDGK